MKGILITAGLVAAALGCGLWWSLQRPPSTAPLDDQASGFTVQASGPGQLITFQDAQTPLRAFRWLPPLPGGALAAQVLSQNDRQRVALFHDGAQDTLLVLKPVGVADGFWRFASLKEAALAPGGILLLLYQAGDAGSAEQPLALAVDVASQQVRWFCRGGFAHLALGPGTNPAVYFYGAKGPVLRLALRSASPHPTPESIELPGQIMELDDLLPTAAGFMVSHKGGLSVRKAGEWSELPAPQDDGPACQGWKSSLTRNGKEIWWQAVPGKVVRVRADGHLGATTQWQLPDEDPFARDAHLLRLLGADPGGSLWFSLAQPLPAAPPGQAPAAGQTPAAEPQAADTPDPAADWGPYAAAGLDRLYRWNPARKSMERLALDRAWAGLVPPAGVQPPAPGRGLAPAAGTLLAEAGRTAWWLPLAALPFDPLKGVQAM
jgi:hypothetical protein